MLNTGGNMKEIIITLLFSIILLLAFCGCSRDNMNDEKEISTDSFNTSSVMSAYATKASEIINTFFSSTSNIDGFSFLRLIRDYSLADPERYQDIVPSPKTTVVIGRESYEGTLFSITDKEDYNGVYFLYNPYPVFMYQSEKGLFGLDPDGHLACFATNEMTLNTPECISLEECKRIAEQFFIEQAPYVDINDYSVSISDIDDFACKNGVYEVVFTKRIDDVDTRECASLIVLKNGQIRTFTSSMLGRITLTENPFDIDAIKTMLTRKINDAVGDNTELFKSIDYEITEFSLTILKNGAPAIIVSIKPSLVFEDGEGNLFEYKDIASFVIQLTDN